MDDICATEQMRSDFFFQKSGMLSMLRHCLAVKANEVGGFEMLNNFPLPFWKYSVISYIPFLPII